MVTALIVINQSGKPSGSPGVSRDDLELGTSVVLTNNDNTGVTTWLWEMESKPVGSSAVISGATLPTASFTPDVAGSYMVKLTVDGPSVDPDTDTRIAAVKTAYLDMRKPAAGEQLEFDAVDGWAAALQVALGAIDDDAAASLKADGSVPLSERSTHPTPQSNKGFIYARDVAGTTHLFYEDSSGTTYQLTPGASGDELVKITSNDTVSGYLKSKLVAGSNITLTELNDGLNETLRVAATVPDNNTLDQAYDQGGAGAGRQIDADAGAVYINATNHNGLNIDKAGTGSLPYDYPALLIYTRAGIAGDSSVRVDHYINDQLANACFELYMIPGDFNPSGFVTGGLAAGDYATLVNASIQPDGYDSASSTWYGLRLTDSFGVLDTSDSRQVGIYLRNAAPPIDGYLNQWDLALHAETGGVRLDDGYVALGEISSEPSASAGTGFLYTADVGGVTALFYLDSYGSLSRLDGYSDAAAAFVDLTDTPASYSGAATYVVRVKNDETGLEFVPGGGLDGYNVKVSSNDTTPGFLGTKVVPGTGISLTQENDGADERLRVALTAGAADSYNAKVSSNDTTPDVLENKIVAGNNVTILVLNDGGDEQLRISASGGSGTGLVDGYLPMQERVTDPSPPIDGYGFLYTKNVHDGYSEYHTELFFMDDYGQVSQVTRDGYLAAETHEDELDPATTDGSETSIVLRRPPTPAADRRSGYALDVYRNGVLMRYVDSLGANPSEWTYNAAQKRVQFVASASAGDWYVAVYQ